MKKIIALLLCTFLALTILAACGGGAEEDITTESITTEAASTEPASTEEATTAGEDSTDEDATETTDADAAAANADANPLVPPANLNTLSRAEQLEYFNLVANNVRQERPGFRKESLLKIDRISMTGAARVANPIVEMVKNSLMPGTPEFENVSKGQGNDGKFFSDNNNASDLRTGDISNIVSTRSGDNWTIRVSIIQETNPGTGTGSANSRILPILTRQQVLDEITDISDLITADVSNATLRYHSGFAQVTVNAQGQVIAAEGGFQVDAQANSVKISVITTNVSAPQSSSFKWTSFSW